MHLTDEGKLFQGISLYRLYMRRIRQGFTECRDLGLNLYKAVIYGWSRSAVPTAGRET